MRKLAAAVVLTTVAAGSGLHAQRPQPFPPSRVAPVPDVPALSVSSRLTLVDVTVTDSKGQAVHGLSARDFSVKEDGKPQPLKTFEEFSAPQVSTTIAPARQPASVFGNRPPSAAGVTPADILLFDQVATGTSRGLQPNPETLKYSKEAAQRYLESSPAGTQVAILELNASGLHIVQGFTSDHQRLLAAVDSITYRLAGLGYWSPDPDGGNPPRTLPALCHAMNFQSEKALDALNQTAQLVSSLPGRKNLIWFSPGTPWLTNYVKFSSMAAIACTVDYTPQLQEAYGRLTAARVAVYPIDPRGIVINPALEASASGPGYTSVSNFAISSYDDNLALDEVAKATGGKAYYSRNDIGGALREAVATGAEYYALSYVPPLSKYDGKKHTIEVKVSVPGVHLEYRRSYTSFDPAKLAQTASSANPLQAALRFGMPGVTQFQFKVRALPSPAPADAGSSQAALAPELKGKTLVRYSIAFDLPAQEITLLNQPDGTRKASVELIVDAYDSHGKLLSSNAQNAAFNIRPEQLEQFLAKPQIIPVNTDLPPGKLTIRVGVRDVESAKIGVLEIPVTVAEP